MILALWLPALFLFFFGLIMGSFLSVVIIRSIQEESWTKGRSRCDSCRKTIAWYDNIPLLSFLILGGKCRHCKKQIPLIHPVVEFLTGMLFVWWYWGGFIFFKLTQQPFSVLQPAFWLGVGVLLLMLFFTDLLYYILPDTMVFSLFWLAALYRIGLTAAGIMRVEDLVTTLIATVVAAAFFFSLWYFTKGKGMGFGDVKLIVPLSLLMGWPGTLVGIMVSFITGAAVGIILILHKKRTMKQIVPFGPFLIIGSMVSLIIGDKLLTWYLSFF